MKFNGFWRKKDRVTIAKRQLLKALIQRNLVAVNNLIVKWQTILGAAKLTDLIAKEVMVECDSDSHSWFCRTFLGQAQYEQMEGKAKTNIFQILLGQGLEPGKDFSFGSDGRILVSDRAKYILVDKVPQQHRASFATQLESFVILDPVSSIEYQLGCAFFSNLTEIAIQQIEILSDSQAAAYLGVLLAGLVSRHPQLRDADFPTRFLFNTLQGCSDKRAMRILNDPETNPQFDEMIIFGHLLAAMGDKQYQYIAEEEGGITLEQLKKLDLVWSGESRIAEIIAMMEQCKLKER
ncbi:hypothetical protein [Nostoc sp. C117]|uniref:hypothetical protein n=1 Tax=Nostoc sp. C117 TaxID=3349875 RepID=UPI00370DE262